MSLDVYLKCECCDSVLYDSNITHNLNKMAEAARIYMELWRPDELGIKRAKELIEPIRAGLAKMTDDPGYYKTFDAPNGWGTYRDFKPWIEKYLLACEQFPEAVVEVSR